jgi:phage virion morphogenesis protein
MIEIKIVQDAITPALERLAARLENMTPINREIAEILYDQTMENFEQQGRPRWEPLAPSTIAARTKRGYWPGKILQVRGELKAAVAPFSDATSAGVSVAKPYAAIQHLGGQAGRGYQTAIPARPYLPADARGQLQPEAEANILAALNSYLAEDLA